jgi:hypothetical protein
MSSLGKYFVKGQFVGQFTTNQDKVLSAGQALPEGDEHQVNIYRGIVDQPTQITEKEFEEAKGYYYFNEVNNIQINASPKWPVENDRIFSMNHLKMNNVQIRNITTSDGKTRGELVGDIIASVSELPFINREEKPYNPGKSAKPFNIDSNTQNNDSGGNNNGNTGNTGGHDMGGIGGSDKPGCSGLNSNIPRLRSGCNTKWLRWLLYLFLILLLLYLLATCTRIGKNTYCKIDNWRIKKEIKLINSDIDTLRTRINQTLPVAEPCGNKIDHNGTNEFWDRRFNIGTQDGTVAIFFNAVYIPDRLEVIYDGKLVAQTNSNNIKGYSELNGKGFQQDSITLYFPYKYDKNKPTELLLRVIPNKDDNRTEWHIDLSCPQ